jgi:hypothetical protein
MRDQQSTSLRLIAGRGLSRISGRVPRYLAKLRGNPTWLPMYVFGRLMPVRRMHWMAAKAAPLSPQQPTIFANVTRESAVDALRRDGLFSGINLPREICDEIAAFAMSTPCFAGSDRNIEFLPEEHAAAEERSNQAILNGNYFEKIQACDAVRVVQQDPLLLDIAAHYLGGQARLTSTRIWWTFATKRASSAEKRFSSRDEYHFDLLDWRMIKFFFYLKPVNEGGGPHVYVRGSHKRRALRHQFTPFIGHPVDEVLKVYGEDQAVTLIGEAGFGFVEDPFGFHKATVAERTPRLAIELAFGVTPHFA